MKALIGQAYHMIRDPKLWAVMEPFPPLGALYAGAVLRERGDRVDFYDAMVSEDPELWVQALQQASPDVAVIYEDHFNYLTKMCLLVMRDLALDMIRAARRHGARVIVSSADATDHPAPYLEAGADLILVGEGEASLVEAMAALEAGTGFGSISGTVFRHDGRIIQTGRQPLISDLDKLPRPAWDLVDFDHYRALWRRKHDHFSLNMVTSRGCPYHCNWCAKPIWGQRFHVRDPLAVADEMAWLAKHAAPDRIWFMDDIFGLKPGWVDRFAEALADRNLRIPFKALGRADLLLRGDTIKSLAAAGCESIWIGAESGSQSVLDAMEKGLKVAQSEEATKAAKAAGIRVGHFIQFGYPGETWSDIKKTLRFLRRADPDTLGISVSYPLPGTPFYERVKVQLGERQNWMDSDDLAMLYRGPFNTHFYRVLHRYTHAEKALRRHLGALNRGGVPLVRSIGGLILAGLRIGLLFPALQLLRLGGSQRIRAVKPVLSPEAAATPSPQGD